MTEAPEVREEVPGITRYLTRNSVYEVQGSRIRRTEGKHENVLGVPDGEWVETAGVGLVPYYFGGPGPGRIVAVLTTGKTFASSPVTSVEEPVQ